MRTTSCKVSHLANPLGFQINNPTFHWTVEDAQGKTQSAARIVVRQAGTMVADTGWGCLDSLATQVDLKLTPRTRYTWTVSVRTNTGEEAVSTENWFETGKMSEPWIAKWISCDNTEVRHPIFRRSISVKKPVESARLYICGLGLYKAYWNGHPVSEEVFAPYCNNYNAWIQTQTYDVTDLVQGDGTLSVLLGNGWYKGRFGFSGDMNPYYGSEWKLIAELHIRCKDGTEQVIGTDTDWEVERSNITFSNIYDGEHRDDTLEKTPAVPAELTEPPAAPLVDRLSVPVTVHEELPVKELIHTPAGELVLDLGQNIAGTFRLNVDAPAGTKIHLQFGEILQSGNFYRENLRSAKAEYIYISDGTAKTITPHFTFYGYRYVKVEGLSNLCKDDFTGLALYSDLTRTGRITTGNTLVNQLLQNIEWGQKGNFLDVPTDCPQRDERMGWTGDAQVFAPTACYQRDCYTFYAKYLHDLATEQLANEGSVPQVIPSFGDKKTSAAWGDAACIIPMVLYRFYGDKAVLANQYPSMKVWVNHIASIDGENDGWRQQFHYGDWLALDGEGDTDNLQGGTDVGLIASTYYLYSTRLTAQAASILGEKEDSALYEALADKILQRIRQEYFSPSGRCCVNTQTAYLLALRHGLSPDSARMVQDLIKKLKVNNGKLQTGFVGTPLLCEELTRAGHSELAYDLLLNEECPGWLYAVKLGATTVWERWNSVLADGSISSTGMNSLNHYAYGSIAEWIYSRCAGIAPAMDSPGFRKTILQPTPDIRLGHLDVEYHSAAGTWKIGWRVLDDTHLELHVTVPFDCEGLLILPYAENDVLCNKNNPLFADVRDGICHLSTGNYSVTYQTSQAMRKIYSTRMPLRELMQAPKVRVFLTQAIPMIGQVPDMMLSMSMRELAVKMGSGHINEEMMDHLDQALAQIR